MVYLASTFKISLLEFGGTKLSPKMKDFIASEMLPNDLIYICKPYLENETMQRIIRENRNRNLYDQSYAVICFFTIMFQEFRWRDMEKVLNETNKSIGKTFTKKFKETPAQGQLNKPLL